MPLSAWLPVIPSLVYYTPFYFWRISPDLVQCAFGFDVSLLDAFAEAVPDETNAAHDSDYECSMIDVRISGWYMDFLARAHRSPTLLASNRTR